MTADSKQPPHTPLIGLLNASGIQYFGEASLGMELVVKDMVNHRQIPIRISTLILTTWKVKTLLQPCLNPVVLLSMHKDPRWMCSTVWGMHFLVHIRGRV